MLLLFFFFLNWRFAASACPVQMSDGQRFVNPMSGLLFCTTCCLAQPCLERRGVGGGRDRKAREEMICHPWFVTVLHQIPPFSQPLFFSSSSSQFVIPGVGWASHKGPGSESAQSRLEHKGKFGQRGEFASSNWHGYENHLDFPPFFFLVFVFVHLGFNSLPSDP